jgi:hypothetical protein
VLVAIHRCLCLEGAHPYGSEAEAEQRGCDRSENSSQRMQPRSDTRLGRTQRYVERFRHLLVRHVLQKRQSYGISLFARQGIQRGVDDLLVLPPKGAFLWTWCLVQHLQEQVLVFVKSIPLGGSALAATELVEDAPLCQTQKPGTERTLFRIKRTRSTPDGQEDLLHELFGRRPFEALQCQIEHQARVAAVQTAERFVLAARQLHHQFFVGKRCVARSG